MSTPRPARVGDLRAAVRTMTMAEGGLCGPAAGVARKRWLVDELCRMLDPQPNSPSNGNAHRNGKGHGDGNGTGEAHATRDAPDRVPSGATEGLSPRMRQTLDRLLAGDSEKEIAARFGRSRHTVHVYVKKLYQRYGVSSRGELFARFVHAPAAHP